MKTAVATADNNWRETMPIWAHQEWWNIQAVLREFGDDARIVSATLNAPDECDIRWQYPDGTFGAACVYRYGG